MAKNVIIGIDKSEVMTEVRRLTSYVGKKTAPDGTAFENVSATEFDGQLLGQWWKEACSMLDSIMTEYLEDTTDYESDYIIKLRMPNNWNDSLQYSMTANCKDFLSHAIVSRWLSIVNMKEQSLQEQQASEYSGTKINDALYSRKRPERAVNPCYCFTNEDE